MLRNLLNHCEPDIKSENESVVISQNNTSASIASPATTDCLLEFHEGSLSLTPLPRDQGSVQERGKVRGAGLSGGTQPQALLLTTR